MKNIQTVSELSQYGFGIDQARSGHYRLTLHGHIVIENSAFEDFYEEDLAESIFVDRLNEALDKWLVIAKAIDEGWKDWNFSTLLDPADINYDGAYDYLLENLDAEYEMADFSGSWSHGTLSYGDYVATGEFGPMAYIKENADGSFSEADKFSASHIVLEHIIYVDGLQVRHIALIDTFSY